MSTRKYSNVLNYLKKLNFFPNTYIAYRILLTTTYVIVEFAERRLSRFKLIRSYLKSTTQETFKWISYIINWKKNIRRT